LRAFRVKLFVSKRGFSGCQNPRRRVSIIRVFSRGGLLFIAGKHYRDALFFPNLCPYILYVAPFELYVPFVFIPSEGEV
jgi:hypothetical protein